MSRKVLCRYFLFVLCLELAVSSLTDSRYVGPTVHVNFFVRNQVDTLSCSEQSLLLFGLDPQEGKKLMGHCNCCEWLKNPRKRGCIG